MPDTRSKIRRRILKDRGLEPERYGSLKPPDLSDDTSKTLAMRLMEARFGKPLEELLMYGNLRQTAKYLGIDQSTVSRWRLRLGLREPGAGTYA